jgi:hypothetical protein
LNYTETIKGNVVLERGVLPGSPPPSKPQARVPRSPIALGLYVLFWVFVFGFAMYVPTLEDPSCFGILRDKHRVLESSPSPKITFIGGSNVLFGVDGVEIGRRLHRPVVNMGVCLMFTLPYIFEEIKSSVKPGDLIVLSPEYSSMSNEYENPMCMADILDGYPRAIEYVMASNCCTLELKGKILFHLRTIGLDKMNYVFTHLHKIVTGRCTWTHGKFNAGLDVLSSANLDKCGGLTWHLHQEKDANIDKMHDISVCKHVNEWITTETNQFADYCKSRGAQLVLIPPPVPERFHTKFAAQMDSLLAECKTKLHVPVLGSSQRYAFADDMIFNGHYHLNRRGRPIRTERLIEDLKPFVNGTEK